MVEQEGKCHIEDRVHGKAEGMDKQCRNMGWLLQGMQLSKWKSFKDKIPQIILGGMWVQKRVCFLSTGLQKLYKPAGFSFAWKEAHS